METAAQLADACAEAFPACDVLLMAAAVADFRPAAPAETKLKKDAVDAPDAIALERTPDVLSGLAAARRPSQTIVGFAAEHGDGALAYAREKLARKRLDAIVVNDISRTDIGFDARRERGHDRHARRRAARSPRAPKGEVAAAILELVARLRSGAGRALRVSRAGAVDGLLHWSDGRRLPALQQGTALLEAGDHHQAAIPLARVRATSRRTRPRSARRSAARCSTRSATRRRPPSSPPSPSRHLTNDYALFCLGRCLQQLGRHAEARRPLAQAAGLRPERGDYRVYRDRSRAAASR